jgi:hypothetical protein
MATKQVKVDIDVKSGSVKIANEESLKLSRQISILIKELENTQKGTAEFELLSAKLNETRDKVAAVKAQSSELFGTFSMLPGPIGDIGSAADGTLSTLKTFSTFTFKDIGVQFKGLFKDVGEVASNLSKATGITKLFNATTQITSKVLNGVGISANASSKGLKIFSGALVATGIGAIVILLTQLITNFDKVRDTLYKLIPGLKSVGDAIGNVINFFTDLIGVTSEAERAEERRQERFKKAAAQTEIINQGIQREINLLKAQGASQDVIDEKRKEAIKNQLKDLKGAANERGVLYGEQAKQYKDLNNELAVIDAEATTRKREETDKNNKEAQQRAQQNGQKAAQQQKDFLQAQADAQVQLIKDQENTVESELRAALEKQYALKNQGKKLSTEVQKQQAAEIDKIVKEEVQKDKETRQKAFEEKIQAQTQNDKRELDMVTAQAESLKIKYGENSAEFRKAQDESFAKQAENLAKERTALEEQQKTRDGLTKEQINRLKEIQIEEINVTNTKDAENKKRIQSDVEAFLKSKEEEKIAADAKFQQDMELAQLDLQQKQLILTAKKEQDKKYYEGLLKTEKLTADQRKKIEEDYTKAKKDNAKAQDDIEKQRVDNQQKLIQAVTQGLKIAADELGKDTLAGKGLAIAAATIDTFGAIAAILKAAGKGPGGGIPGFAIAQSVLAGYAGFKAVQGIVNTQVPTGGSGGGGSSQAPQVRQLASGGYVSGPGTGTSDSIPAYLSNGESIINASSTRMFRPLLSTINQIGGGRRFAEGGVVSSTQAMDELNAQLANSATQPIKTYVVAQDMTSMQMFDRAQKSRSTL